MNDPDDFDALLAKRFAREHSHVPADAFIADTMRAIRVMQKRQARRRITLQVTALVLLMAVSPWLIDAVARLDAAMESSFTLFRGSGTWFLAALAAGVMLARGVLRRR